MNKALLFFLWGLTTFSLASASNPEEQEEFRGNWTKTFTLIDGSTVLHTPDSVSLGFMKLGKGITLDTPNYNGFPVKAPIQLKTNSTLEEFLQALRITGLLKETK